MSIEWTTYDAMLTQHGNNLHDINIDYQKEDFRRNAVNNPAYSSTATRNGVAQDFLILRGDVTYKANLITFPDETICAGDMIEYNGLHWLVYEVIEVCSWQKKAVIWQCNLQLSFQNNTSEIVTKWCVWDSGVFSTTVNGNEQIQTKDKQFNLWMSMDTDTEKLYVGKRIAVGKEYNHLGEQILDIYKITGHDPIGRSYGIGSHLIKFNTRNEADYNADTDNLTLLICDYISPESPTPTPVLLTSEISGRSQVRIGTSRSYSAVFYGENGTTVVGGVTPVWSIYPELAFSESGGNLVLTIPNSSSYIGTNYVISLNDEDGLYDTATFNVEVIS